MKQTYRGLILLLAVVLLLSSLACTAFATEEINWDTYIQEYQSDGFNDFNLEIGQQATAIGSTWVSGGGNAYSSDESVVTVDANGIVTAKGEGTAYVVCIGITGMYKVNRFQVVAPAASEPTEQTNPTQAPIIETAPSTNNNSNSFKPNFDQQQQSAVEKIESIQKDSLGDEQKSLFTRFWGFFAGFGIFFAVVLALVIYGIVDLCIVTSKTMGARVLPPVSTTARTITKPAPKRDICPKCGKPYGDADFCPACGTPRQATNIYQFPISAKLTGMDFEELMNQWLAENPYICNCKLNVDYGTTSFALSVKHKFYVRAASIEFDVAPTPQPYQYGVAFLYKRRAFEYHAGQQCGKWLEKNPGCTILSSVGGRIKHWGDYGNFCEHYTYIFYKKK